MLLLEWELFPSPHLLCISIKFRLSNSLGLFTLLCVFPFPCYPTLKCLTFLERSTKDNTWLLASCVSVIAVVAKLSVCCSMWTATFWEVLGVVVVYVHIFGLQECVLLGKILLILDLSEIIQFCIGQYTTNTCVDLFRTSLTTFETFF